MLVKPLLTALLVLVALGGCDDGDSDSAALTVRERRYCELIKQFGARMPKVPRDTDPELFIAQMSDTMDKNTAYFDELLDTAPKEIRPVVEKAISTLQRVAAGDIQAFDEFDSKPADDWEEEHCYR